MTLVAVDSREICALMDKLEADIKRSDWWYGSNGRTLQDVWASRSVLGNDPNETLLDAFQNNQCVVLEYYMPGSKASAVGAKTIEAFSHMWNETTSEGPVKLFLIPPKGTMMYDRTFRCSERALDYFGPSLKNEFLQAQYSNLQIDPTSVLDIIKKLANRKEAMVVLAFKPLDGIKAQCGNALIIDCIPVLETLGPDFTTSDLTVFSAKGVKDMMDLLSLSNEDPRTQQAWSEIQEHFNFKMMRTFDELPGFPPPSVLSKKLVKVPVTLFCMGEETPAVEETMKLPHGAITLSRIDTAFMSELIMTYMESRQSDWMKLRSWVCDTCGETARRLMFHGQSSVSLESAIDAPLTGYIIPVCGDKKCSLLQRQMIDKSLKAVRKTRNITKAVYCEHCRKHEPSDGPLFSKCSRCKTVFYCSKSCQKADWRAGHKNACQARPKFNVRLDPKEFEKGGGK